MRVVQMARNGWLAKKNKVAKESFFGLMIACKLKVL